MTKRGELSLNVIVMATIAVLVLVVLSYIFINGAKIGNDGLLSCTSKQGVCQVNACDKETHVTMNWQCPKQGSTTQICCIDKEDAFGFS